MPSYTFQVPDSLVGKTLQSIKDDFGPSSTFNMGRLENNLWRTAPFTKGQTFTFQSEDPTGGADLPVLTGAFGNPTSSSSSGGGGKDPNYPVFNFDWGGYGYLSVCRPD